MKKFLSTLLAVGCALSVSADVVLERFDTADKIAGKILPNSQAQQLPEGGTEKGCLYAKGNGKSYQYIYACPIKGNPGDKYALALNYKTTKFSGNGFMFIITYQMKKGVKAVPSTRFILHQSFYRWTHRQFEFTLPEGAVGATVNLRLAGMSPKDQVWVDFLRIAPVINGVARGIDLASFETTFDQWAFDKHLIYDHFMLGRGGKIVNEWRHAKVGEAFFQAEGNNEKMQYALYIDNIKVKPNSNYVFEAWIKATENFKYNANGMLIFFYKDKNGRICKTKVSQSRYHVRSTGGQWKELIHTFTTPADCEFVDIGLNLRKMKATDIIQLDHLRFKEAGNKIYVKTETNSKKAQMTVTTALTGSIKAADVASSKLIITDDNKNAVKTITLPAGQVKTVVDLKAFKDGKYYIKPELTLKNGKVMTADATFFGVYNNPDWINDIGVQTPEMTPPAPWKALAGGGDTVENWSGSIKFGKDGMIKQVNANKADILAAPISITVNGGKLALNAPAIKVQPSMAETKVDGKSGDFTISGKIASDYLGHTRYTLTVKASKDTVLKDFTLNVPVKEVDFVHRCDGSWSHVGVIDLNEEGKEIFTTNRFYDNVLFGTIDRGISFFQPKVYPASKRLFKNNYLTVDKKGMTIDMVAEDVALKAGESRVFDFSLLAYPYRPAENNWRKLRFRAGKKYSNFGLIWHAHKMFKYAGSLAATDEPELMKNYLAGTKGYPMFYQIPMYILESIPQWSYFKDQWFVLPSRGYNMKGYPCTKGDYRSKLWQDLYVKYLAEMIRDYKWKGVYYDCFGSDHFTENGEHFTPVFDVKTFAERIYIAQRMHDKDNLTVHHAGADQGGTMSAYANVVLMGEQYRGQFYSNTYFNDFMSINRFRYENASNIGPDRMLLPQYRQEEKTTSPKVATHLSGMAILHKLLIYPNFIDSKTELSVRDRMHAFGLEDADFVGYWEKGKPVIKTGDKDVFASYFYKQSGAFAAVLNYSKVKNTVKLDIPFTYKSAVIFDPVIQKEVPYNGQAIELEPSMAKFITFVK